MPDQSPQEGDLRIWWIPQIPMKPFEWPVADLTQAKLLLDVLAEYDLFQYENKIKPDYYNTGGLQVFEDSEWLDWRHPETGDDLDEHFASLEDANA